MRNDSAKTLVSLCLLNLFVFVQLLAASEKLSHADQVGKGPQLHCARVYWALVADVEVVSTDVFIAEPTFVLVGTVSASVCFVTRDYFMLPGRGPPVLFT